VFNFKRSVRFCVKTSFVKRTKNERIYTTRRDEYHYHFIMWQQASEGEQSACSY